ncbi:L,D-transpeptidase family protein [Deminuibacter soli]|uniref:Murein L,D-transpeptidase n=1 Tax=Deminuibacter soli TaxID=2291815 RepID=A0A3E1NRS4_9BACT|nr:L,D-transpeptidase [Deminuibacter soli]RFM30612.1 murein L,D-transpeptidase [Deminuibacter soli]
MLTNAFNRRAVRASLLVFACGALFTGSTSFCFRHSFNNYSIVIDKSDYELNVYDSKGWLIAYPVVFGSNDQHDKFWEGDRRTPDGHFRIVSKRVHEKWDRFMMLDYPTPENIALFNARKSRGLIPASARIGGGIGIHGTWPHEDYAIDRYQNWTMGCISMKNEDVEALYRYIPVGTSVTIQP